MQHPLACRRLLHGVLLEVVVLVLAVVHAACVCVCADCLFARFAQQYAVCFPKTSRSWNEAIACLCDVCYLSNATCLMLFV